MKTRLKHSTLYVLSLIVSLCFLSANSQELKELTLEGGLMYTAWSDSNESITCGLTIETPTALPADRYPIQVVIIIDASIKMEGAAIQQAKVSAKTVVDLLSDKDMFGLITYSQYAREVFSLQPLNQNNRRSAASAINRIKYEKGRNLSEGLKKGAEQFGKFKGQRSSGQYVLLITNGNPNQGTTDYGKLLSQATTLAGKYNFHITTIGYDRFYNEDFLIGCAEKTGGRAYFIEEEEINTMTKVVTDEIRRITETCVQEVTLEIITPSSTTIVNVYGGTMKDDKIIVGNLSAGLKQSIIFDLKGRPSRRKDLEVNVDYVEPVRMTPRTTREYIDIPVSSGKPDYDKNFAPLLLNYTIQKGLAEAIVQIRNSEKYVRKDFAVSFKETIKLLEQDNVTFKSDYLSEAIEYFKQVRHDIENGAIEDDLLTKRIKYKFLKLTYGTPVDR